MNYIILSETVPGVIFTMLLDNKNIPPRGINSFYHVLFWHEVYVSMQAVQSVSVFPSSLH